MVSLKGGFPAPQAGFRAAGRADTENSVTRPNLFRTYLTEQIRLLI